MRTFVRSLAVLLVSGTVVGTAAAQFPNNQVPISYPVRLPNGSVVNPNYLRNGPNGPISISQSAYNTALAGAALSRVPPYGLGFGGYPRPFIGGGGAPLVYTPPIAPIGPNIYGPQAAPIYPNSAGTATLTSVSTLPSAGGSSIYSVPTTGYDPYAYNPYQSYTDPLSGYLHGTADVYRAQADYRSKYRQSQLVYEQVRQARVETQRRIFDEWLYERANTPSIQDIREENIKMERRRALTEPPLTEVLSAGALNTLLGLVQEAQAKGAKGPEIKLDPEVIKHLNVTWGPGYSLGPIKYVDKGAPLSWPAALEESQYQKERDKIGELLPRAVGDASTRGKVDAGTMQELRNAVNEMQKRLGDNIHTMTPSQYIPTRRYLNQFSDALDALQQPDADRLFNRLTKVETVNDLLHKMKGLRFAPAASGDEQAYAALHQALVSYAYSVQGQTGTSENKDLPK